MLYPLLFLVHALAALIGLAIAAFSEVGRVRAVADGSIDTHERQYLVRLGWGLRISVLTLLIVNPLLMFLEYMSGSAAQHSLMSSSWFEMTVLVFLIADLWLLSKKYLPLWFGGAVSLASYITVAILAIWGSGTLGYFELFVLYAVGIFVIGGLLEYAHIVTRTYEPTDSPA